MSQESRPRPIVLCILDGWGHRDVVEANAIRQGRTPVLDGLWRDCPHALIDASAQEVGLIPKWEFEVGSWFSTTSTDLRADTSRGDLGTDIDLEEVLGLDKDETVLRLSAARRFGPSGPRLLRAIIITGA